MNGTAAKSASAVSVPPVPPVNICSMALAKASPMACTNASITGGAVPPATAGIAIIKTIRSAINTSDTSVNIDEMTMPAMATPLYLSPVSLERLKSKAAQDQPEDREQKREDESRDGATVRLLDIDRRNLLCGLLLLCGFFIFDGLFVFDRLFVFDGSVGLGLSVCAAATRAYQGKPLQFVTALVTVHNSLSRTVRVGLRLDITPRIPICQ